MTNRISSGVKTTLTCGSSSGSGSGSGSGGGSGSGSGSGSGTNSSSFLTLGTSTSSLTINSGSSGTLTVNVGPKSGSFNGTIYLSCSGLPSSLKCSFAPGSVVPGAGAGSSILTIAALPSGASNYNPRPTFVVANWITGFGLFGFLLVGKFDGRRLIRILGATTLAVVMIGAVSCGGNKTVSSVSTASVSRYLITIDETTGTTKLSTTVTVTVH